MARSSTEVEYRSLAMASIKLVWLKSLLYELEHVITPSVLWCDKLGATFLSSNPYFHTRTKYIELVYHFIRRKIVDGSICIRFICSQNQLEDALIKLPSSPHFLTLRTKLIVTPFKCA
jgi:hypothetical protein